MEPNGCRVTAVRVEDQGRQLVAFVPAVAMPAVLQDLRGNGQAALSFTRPTDDRAVQVKGEFVATEEPVAADESFVRTQIDAFLKQLTAIGLPAAAATSTWAMWPCVAVRIRVTALFSQTPGPDAGSVLT
jgi:hypothetical protein